MLQKLAILSNLSFVYNKNGGIIKMNIGKKIKIQRENRYMTRQEVAFLEECRKIKGCGILKRNFYTRFIPIFKDFGL